MPVNRGKIFVVDEDMNVSDSLRRLLEPLMFQVHAFPNAQSFLAACEIDGPDCVILDVWLPDISGLLVQETLTQRLPHLPVIFLTGYGDVTVAVRAMKAGALDFIAKPASDLVLLEAIQSAMRHAREKAKANAETLALRERLDSLTDREMEILEHIVAGRSAKEIAKALSLSPRTVETHRARILAKTRTNSIAHLVWIAARAGVFDSGSVAVLRQRLDGGPER